MKKNIGDKVTFKVGEKNGAETGEIHLTGKITDVYELGLNDYVYEVTTSSGVFHLNNNLEMQPSSNQ